jgi:hypothetical protein
LEKLWAVVRRVLGVKRGEGSKWCEKIDILARKKRKNCFVRAITTIDHNWFAAFLRVSTVFCVGI